MLLTLTGRQAACLFVMLVLTSAISYHVGHSGIIREASAKVHQSRQVATVADTKNKNIEVAAPGARIVTMSKGTPDEATNVLIPTAILCAKETAPAPHLLADCYMATATHSEFISYTLDADKDSDDDDDGPAAPLNVRT
jgi:hypothetical protein